jgi:hypothetical protein
MAKFKVGDKVLVIRCCTNEAISNYHFLKVGTIYKIDEVDNKKDYNIWVEFNRKRWDLRSEAFIEEELVLATKAAKILYGRIYGKSTKGQRKAVRSKGE